MLTSIRMHTSPLIEFIVVWTLKCAIKESSAYSHINHWQPQLTDKTRQWLCQAGTDNGTIYSHLCLAGSKQVKLSYIGWKHSSSRVSALHLRTRMKVHISLFNLLSHLFQHLSIQGWVQWILCAENMCVGGRSGHEYNSALGELVPNKNKWIFVCLYKYVQTNLHKLISIELL